MRSTCTSHRSVFLFHEWGWMKSTTHKIWRYRSGLSPWTEIHLSSVIITSYQLFLDTPKDGICSSSSEALSWVGVKNEGVWQRLSFLIKYHAAFLLYLFFFSPTIFLLLFCIWGNGRQNQLMYTLTLLLLLTVFFLLIDGARRIWSVILTFFQILKKLL